MVCLLCGTSPKSTMEVEKEGCIMKIAMANDHAGTALKNQIKE